MMMECAKTGRLKKEGGFTLVELIIALTLLLLISLAFIPMFVYITEASQSNKARLVALKLASSKIEEIRALPYDEVGTVGGNPQGVIPQTETKPIEGINYIIETQIGWVNDPSDDDAGGNDPLPYDYKSVKVKVTAPSSFTGEVVKTIDTLVAEEGEERVLPGGNIEVKVQRAWYEPGSQPEAVEGVKIEVAKKYDPGTRQTGWTSDNGVALFAALEEGEYVVQADAGIQGMMVRPDQVPEEVSVFEGSQTPCTIEVEYPSSLEIELINKNTGATIVTGGVLRLSTLNASVPTEEVNFNSDANGVISADTIGDLWPAFGDAYEVEVSVDGYFPYSLQNDINQEWDGSFSTPDEEKIITVELTPAANNAIVTVVDDGDSPVAGANVKIFEHEFVYQSGSWDLSGSRLLYSRVTDAASSLSVALWDSKDKPAAPTEGDAYTIYGVSVAKDGYHDFAENEAFWISEGKQMDGTGEIDAYQVNLAPYSSSIRVEVFERVWFWMEPVEGVSVKVTGPNFFEKTLQTNSEGEAVFTALRFGEYDVVVSHGGTSQTWHVMISEEKEYYKRFDFN
jgi:type II secretory pathway pseudopilin PulG